MVMTPTTPILASDTGEDSVIDLTAAANTVDTVISEVIVREVYERIGYQVEITKYPPERALKLANSGQADGDVQRIGGLSEHYPNLIQLKPATNYIEGSVFTAGKDISVDGWDSLREHASASFGASSLPS